MGKGNPLICPACQENRHGQCSNTAICACAFRGHPDRVQPYIPRPAGAT